MNGLILLIELIIFPFVTSFLRYFQRYKEANVSIIPTMRVI